MKRHITKTVAMLLAVLMLMSMVPAAALPEITLPEWLTVSSGDGTADGTADSSQTTGEEGAIPGDSVTDDDEYDFADGVTLGKDSVENTDLNAQIGVEASDGKVYDVNPDLGDNERRVVNSSYSPYEPYTTTNENHPFLPGNAAWIDLSKIYYGAPATPNYPITKWSANTSVYNVTGTDEYYGKTDDTKDVTTAANAGYGKEIYSLPDLNLIDEYLWAGNEVQIDSLDASSVENGIANSGTPIYDETTGKLTGYTGYTVTGGTNGVQTVTKKTVSDAATAYVYNRYDAMQGKWGLTLDRNVSSVAWLPSWVDNYYCANGKTVRNMSNDSLDNSALYLTDTPYLYYSTEALDSTQIAISILIGTPVQTEEFTDYTTGRTQVTDRGDYEFRWYTITDDADRPGIDAKTMGNSMIPNVYVSEPVLKDFYLTTSGGDIFKAIQDQTNGATMINPIALAESNGVDTETLYVNGSITGCIDFTQILPLVMGSNETGDLSGAAGNGSSDVKYKIAQIRVDTKTDTSVDGSGKLVYPDAEDSAARINYLYFGPGQSMIYTPQSTVGNTVNAANWMYAQTDDDIGDEEPKVHEVGELINSTNQYACGYVNGWQNGQAVSITNTPNTPQLMTIDTYGKSGGTLITYDQYKELTGKTFVQGSNNLNKTGANATAADGGAANSRIWKYEDANGVTQYLEAEYNEKDGNYYIMVSVPVRKWIDVLGNSRKLSFTLTVEKYSGQTDSDGNVIKPGFGLWGNEAGSLGAGHSSWSLDSRFDHEDILAIFNNEGGFYQVDSAYNYEPAEVDLMIGDSTMYNDANSTTVNESWFDLLRSAYMLDSTVTGGSARFGYGDEMVGYCYVSAMRFAVPIGAKFSIQNMKGDGNSAGLNLYSATGSIVSAYDGGTGAQPNINVSDTASSSTLTDANGNVISGTTEVMAQIDDKGTPTDYADDTYYYQQYASDTDGIKGTQKAAAAAYGPYLQTSYYTIYDLLDTEKLHASGSGSHQADRQGLEEQKIYGKAYINQTNVQFPITAYAAKTVTYWDTDDADDQITNLAATLCNSYGYTYTAKTEGAEGGTGNSWNRAFGYTYAKGTEITVYAVLYFKAENEFWGLTGALEKDGTSWMGYVLLADGADNTYDSTTDTWTNNAQTWYFATSDGENEGSTFSEYGYLYDGNLTLDKSAVDYYSYASRTAFGEATTYDKFRQMIQANLKDEWYYSNIRGGYNNFQSAFDADADGAWDDITTHAGQYPVASDVYNGSVLGDYANHWSNAADTNGSLNVADFKVVSENATDMKIIMNTVKGSAANNWSVGISRTFSNPITVRSNNYSGSADYPAFYFDYSADDTDGGTNTTTFALTVRANSKTYLYYLDTEGILHQDNHETAGDGNGTPVWGYYDLEPLFTNLGVSSFEIVGFNMYFWRAAATRDTDTTTNDAEITIRRMEIWQVETNWLDEINYVTRDSESIVVDSMNIINDAYFHMHDETKDGQYILTPVQTDTSSAAREGYEVTDTINTVSGVNSYRKENSNKGWSARISTDTNGDGKILADDKTYTSGDGTAVENIYEYRTALGHLRVWVPAGQQASVAFEADRSFNTDNYRYLYYSYSVRDFETGISSEENTGETGISVAIKSQQNTSDRAYLEKDGTWVYYPEETAYWDNYDHDNRVFNTNMCAAIDLSTLDGIESVNQFVFYLKNGKEAPAEGEDAVYSEFYINYIYLSNVPPVGTVAEELQETQVQYYYLMDNTGDRYSARFPTIDNPTGQVTGSNSDEDRVNPVVVERGQRLIAGTYLNGDLLYTYGTAPDGEANRTFNDETESIGYYEKNYNYLNDNSSTDIMTGSFKSIWFYDGDSSDNNDINDYYIYRDRVRLKDVDGDGVVDTVPADGDANIYDMLWSYGRWFTGEGESGLNMMYVADPNDLRDTDTPNGVSGNLVRRYATENYVLLRSGIQPLKYLTYYDTKGGQIVYTDGTTENTNTNTAIQDGVMVNENNYYITETVLFSYFSWPQTNDAIVAPTKYGYQFMGWHTTTDLGDDDVYEDATNKVDHLYKYHKKTEPGADYFYAEWKPLYEVEGSGFTESTNYTANFYLSGTDTDGDGTHTVTQDNVWFTRNANYDNDFEIVLPQQLQIRTSAGIKPLTGWQVGTKNEDGTYTVDSSSRIYSPGTSLTVTQDVMFFPVVGANTDSQVTYTITVTGAKLMLYTGEGNTPNDPKNMHITYDIDEEAGTATYFNVPRNLVMIAIPFTATESSYWEVPFTNSADHVTYTASGTGIGAVVCLDYEEYKFSVYGNMSLKYTSPKSDGNGGLEITVPANKTQHNLVVTTMPDTVVTDKDGGREMIFVSQFDASQLPEGAQVLAAGTLYTKSGANFEAIKDALDADMRLLETYTAEDVTSGIAQYATDDEGNLLKDEDGNSIIIPNIANFGKTTFTEFTVKGIQTDSTYVRHVVASTYNDYNQYYFMVTENKGNAVTYYARGYVIYTVDGVQYVAYSDIVASASVEART